MKAEATTAYVGVFSNAGVDDGPPPADWLVILGVVAFVVSFLLFKSTRATLGEAFLGALVGSSLMGVVAILIAGLFGFPVAK